MKPFLLSVILLFCLPSHAQTTLDDYRRDVTEYSRRLKVAAAGSDAAAEAVGRAGLYGNDRRGDPSAGDRRGGHCL